MKEKIQNIKNNKLLKIIGNIIYTIFFILIVLILLVAVLQRTSNNEVSFGGYRIFVVATGSMVPKYEVGDVLVAKETEPENLAVGDDIVYTGKEGSFKDKVVTHQIISIEKENENYKIITKGLANTGEDPEITQNEVMGKIVCRLGFLTVLEKMVSNNYVFFFVLFVPIALITFKQIKNAMSEEDDDEEEEEENN